MEWYIILMMQRIEIESRDERSPSKTITRSVSGMMSDRRDDG